MAEIILTNGGVALVDDDDFARLSAFRWNRSPGGYARRSDWSTGKQKTVTMHREIAQAAAGQYVDHINFNKLDNRKENLRTCTPAENNRYRQKRGGATSQYIGVSFSKQANKWKAGIKVYGQHYHLGYYDSEVAASKAYESASRFYFGAFAPVNKETA